METPEPKIEKELSREEIIAELKDLYKNIDNMYSDSDSDYADGFGSAVSEIENRVKDLLKKIGVEVK